MANIFQKAIKGLLGGVSEGIVERLNGDAFYVIGNFFGYAAGNRNIGKFLKAYSRNPLVYMIIHKIGSTSAAIQRMVINPDNQEPIDEKNSKIWQILSEPNQEQGYMEFMEEVGEYLLATGNTFIEYTEGVGMGTELKPLNPSRMALKITKSGEPMEWEYTDNMGTKRKIPLEDVLHIKTSNIVDVTDSKVYFGMSPLESAWLVVRSADEIFLAEASIMKNRGIMGILTNDTDVPMLEDERKEAQEEFDQETAGAHNFNKMYISSTRLRFVQTGMSPTDLKLLEGIMNKLRLLCACYGVSSVLFNDNENSTYNNVTEAKRAAYLEAYIPLAQKLDKELSKWLSDKLNVSEEVVVDLTSIEVIKASTNELAQAINNLSPLVANRVMENLTIDEIRGLVEVDALENGAGEGLAGPGGTSTTANVNG